MRDFNQSVAEAISWVESSSSWDETVIIVTADHETGFIWGPDSGGDSFVPVGNNGKGNVPDFEWYSGSHTNSLVPVYAKGSGSETVMQFADEVDPERGNYITNSEIAQIIFRLLEQ
jgi:alkaline phosphatase